MENTRLYRLFQPRHYILHVTMDRPGRRFRGTVTIQGVTTSTYIPLNAHKLHITKASIDSKDATFTHNKDLLSVSLEGLQPGDHEVTLEFEGKITNPMHGLYPCYFKLDGQNEELLATQFESHHAREVFPCVDEPEAKATFDLTLTTEPGVTVVSNTPVKSQHSEDGQLTTVFSTTPTMSTYLLAWVAGKLDFQEATTKDGVTVRAYAVKGKGNQLGYALNAAVQQLEFMNDYYGVPYPLPKCDLIALPDFSAGAMENWGCIAFREKLMLVDEHSSTYARQFVTMVIAHELAHQWFGDLVTMRWWNDLWLNESFANWMEYSVPARLNPNWQLMTQYYDGETTFAMERDGLASVQKIQQEVHSPEEIQSLFDPAIVYAKGGSLINMLHDYLGDETFRKGLKLYFERHKYSNTEADDLWKAWTEASKQDVMSFMLPWITQPGYPMVSVEEADGKVRISQQRYFSNPAQAKDQAQLWPIPLLSKDQLPAELLNQQSISLPAPYTDQPLLLNQGRTGYYIVRYSPEHTAKLAAEVQAGRMSVIDRTGLLNDNLNLSEAGHQPFLTALRLLESYKDENSMAVWDVITSYIGTLKLFAGDNEQHISQLRRLVGDLAAQQYARLGMQPIANEPYFDELLRPMILQLMAYAEDAGVIAAMRSMFDQAKQPQDIWSDIRPTVFTVAARFGGEAAYEKMLAWYKDNPSAEQRTQLAVGLCSSEDPAILARAIQLLTTDVIKLQDIFYWVINLMRNRFARDMAWQWMQDNWQWILDHFGNDIGYADFVKYVAGSFSRADQLASYKAFFVPMLNQPDIGRTIRQGIEDIEGRMQWIARDGSDIAAYLQNYTSSSQAVTR